MITIEGKQLRNLEEQVGFLTEQYNINQGIAEWGIKVKGILESPELLPSPSTYDGDYGDAYAVGTSEPYDFYIWTRAAVAGQPGFWFNFGNIAIAGPQGPAGERGPQGEKGERGSQWFSGSGQPTTTSGYNAGDYYINVATGNIWHLHDEGGLIWLLEGNIKGPQGPRGNDGARGPAGPQGEKGIAGPAGPAGPIVDLIGELASIDQLPSPTSVPRQSGYLISDGTNLHTWIIIGEGSNLLWYDAGIFGTGTIVFQNGSPISEFDADTKLNIPSNGLPVGQPQFLMIKQDGEIIRQYLTGTNPANIPVYSYASQMNDLLPADATLYVATPRARGHAANKQYVDDAVANAGGGASSFVHNIKLTAQTVDSGTIILQTTITNNHADTATGTGSLDTLLAIMDTNVNYPAIGFVKEPSGSISIFCGIKKKSNGNFAVTRLGIYLANPVQYAYELNSYLENETDVTPDAYWWVFDTISIVDSV